jgi:hypothetical protein
MKKLFILLQWAVVIALVLFGVRMLTHRTPPPVRQPETWTSWSGFHALSFAGITRSPQPGCLTRRQLARHLEALSDAGYRTIFPQEAMAFLAGQHPLPDRAVLLLFEGGRKDSFVHATPLLRRHQAVATLFVPTALIQEDHGSFFLRPGELAKVTREPHWQLGSMGHRALQTETDAEGTVVRFLSQRRAPAEGAPEGDDAYRARVLADLAEASRFLARSGAITNHALLLPYADDGRQPGADPLAAEAIADAIRMLHPVAFTRADRSFNGPDCDPHALSSLRVPGEWDSERLLAELRAEEPRTTALTGPVSPQAWTLEGAATTHAGELHLEPGTHAWLRGTAGWSDAGMVLGLRRAVGASAVLYLRHAGPDRYLRLRVGDQGCLLQEKMGDLTQTLYADRAPAPGEGTVQVQLKGNRLWLYLDDRLRAGPIPLARITRHGQVGVAAEDGTVAITHITARPETGRLALSRQGYRAVPATERASIRTLITPWYDARRTPSLTLEQREDLLLAADAGITYIPRIEGGQDLTEEQAATLVNDIARTLDQDMTRALVTALAVDHDQEILARALRHRGYTVTHLIEGEHLPADGAARAAEAHADAWVVQAVSDELLGDPVRWKRLAPTARLALEISDAATPVDDVMRVVRF